MNFPKSWFWIMMNIYFHSIRKNEWRKKFHQQSSDDFWSLVFSKMRKMNPSRNMKIIQHRVFPKFAILKIWIRSRNISSSIDDFNFTKLFSLPWFSLSKMVFGIKKPKTFFIPQRKISSSVVISFSRFQKLNLKRRKKILRRAETVLPEMILKRILVWQFI